MNDSSIGHQLAALQAVPRISAPIMAGFRRFNRYYLGKHFHAIAVDDRLLTASGIVAGDALVVYANHASWWDPLTAMFLASCVLPGFRQYAPIDANAFQKYRMFGKMGFYPVDQNSLSGAAAFLSTSRRILAQPGASIWITPEGRFADVRDVHAPLMPGLAHLAAKQATQARRRSDQTKPRIWFLPLSVEYSFWEERLPEALARFGNPICAAPEIAAREMNDARDKLEWHRRLSDGLRSCQGELAKSVIARDSEPFRILLSSRSGTFFLYDWWRSLRSWATGKRINLNHSDQLRQRS